MTELTDLALSQVSDMLASGEITAVELVEANLRTIERTEPVVHAYANVLADEALAAAREADTEIAAGKTSRSFARRADRRQRQYLHQRHRHRKWLAGDGGLRAGL